jgi:glutamate synthase (NADPH/NADH) small chain
MSPVKQERVLKLCYGRLEEVPKRAWAERIRDFAEVSLGLDERWARKEATRCFVCDHPNCVEGCPAEVKIPQFIEHVRKGEFEEALAVIKETNSLPGVCGRVCPQEEQCERNCKLGRKGQPVSILKLERFVADWCRAHGAAEGPRVEIERNGHKVAVVGSGPAGLTCAADLAKLGYEVTVFEALHELGGVLVYGIPEFRLPNIIVEEEVRDIRRLGVEFLTDVIIGKTLTIQDLRELGYEAVFIGTGAGAPILPDIPGINLNGVYSANEFLTRSNLMRAYRFPEFDTPIYVGKRVAVVGGGNVAMDSARTALRLGAEKVYLVYRRSREEMPARIEEVRHAEEEGIEFVLLTNPTRVLGRERVEGLECIRMRLGEPDSSGRRRPIPIEGSEFTMEVDTVIMAIGQDVNPLLQRATEGLAHDRWDRIQVDATGQTTLEGVFAGGDVISGAATVIKAIGDGKRAARSIHAYLQAKHAPVAAQRAEVRG